MKELLIRAAADHVARTPLDSMRRFMRAWLLGSMAVSAAVCGNAVVQGLIGPVYITSRELMALPVVFVIWIVIAAIPVLVLLLAKWILFG